MIIGIAGAAGTGKSECADILVKRFGFVSVALADVLKRMCAEIFEFTDSQLFGPSEMRNALDERYPLGTDGIGFLTPRYALQTLGSEWGRRCNEDTWIRYALKVAASVMQGAIYTPSMGLQKYATKRPLPPGVVLPDVRYLNEVQAIKAIGGKIWSVERPQSYDEMSATWRRHSSEVALKNYDGSFDAVIHNDRSLEELQTQVMGIASIDYKLEQQ
jgi:hypothetical protein